MSLSTSKPAKSTSSTSAKKPLKVALLCDDSLDKQDGVQQYVLTLGRWLDEQGHEVHYLTSTTTREDLPNLHVLSKNKAVKFNGNRLHIPLPASPKRIKELLATQQYDIIHIQMPYSPLLAGLVIRYTPPTTALVGTFHIYPESNLVAAAARGLGLLVSRQLKRFDFIMSVSEAAQDFAQTSHGIETVIVPNMVDVHRFLMPVTSKKRNEPVKVVFLGRLVERKGAQHLIRAVAYMHEHNLATKQYHVSVGGKGPLHDELEQYVRAHKLDKLISFDGFVEESDKVHYLAQADVAVFPSTGGESFGISLIEAMAASRGAIIAGDNPGYRSVMAMRQLVNPGDTDTFAHMLARYISRPEDRSLAKRWQRQKVKEFDVSVVGAQIESRYISALRSKRG